MFHEFNWRRSCPFWVRFLSGCQEEAHSPNRSLHSEKNLGFFHGIFEPTEPIAPHMQLRRSKIFTTIISARLLKKCNPKSLRYFGCRPGQRHRKCSIDSYSFSTQHILQRIRVSIRHRHSPQIYVLSFRRCSNILLWCGDHNNLEISKSSRFCHKSLGTAVFESAWQSTKIAGFPYSTALISKKLTAFSIA